MLLLVNLCSNIDSWPGLTRTREIALQKSGKGNFQHMERFLVQIHKFFSYSKRKANFFMYIQIQKSFIKCKLHGRNQIFETNVILLKCFFKFSNLNIMLRLENFHNARLRIDTNNSWISTKIRASHVMLNYLFKILKNINKMVF